jgi:bifunctional non-homologous end joining protein LigD
MSPQRPPAIALAFIEPCLPCVALLPPSGDEWLHEVKHDGHRLLARRDGSGVRLFNQRGEDWTDRFPPIADAIGLLPVRSCIIDGELVGCDANGNTPFASLRGPAQDFDIALHAFDLLEVNGFDVRRDPVEERKRALEQLLRKASDSVRFNPHFERDGEAVFRQACRMGFAGIVSKRRGSRYLSGRCSNWLITKKMD